MNVTKLDKQIAQLQSQRNKVLQAEKQTLLGKIAQIDAILSGKVKIASPKTRKVKTVKHSSSGFARGAVKAAITQVLVESGKPMTVAEIFSQISAKPEFVKITETGLRNNCFALANSSTKSITKVARGTFALPAVVAPVVTEQVPTA